MRELGALVKRNVKLFFKDKGLFFTSLITPMILLVLYATFLANVYRDSFLSAFPEGAKPSVMALGYYVATVITSMSVCLVALGAGFVYLAVVGWYVRFFECVLLLADVFLLVLFGTALSSLINHFLSSQGQISAVGTIVSAGYGFICGAYMPISQFGKGIQTAVSLLPGTYGTALVRNHALGGVFEEWKKLGYPLDELEQVKANMDCSLSLFGHNVSVGGMYAIMAVSILLLIAAYVLVHVFVKQKDK